MIEDIMKFIDFDPEVLVVDEEESRNSGFSIESQNMKRDLAMTILTTDLKLHWNFHRLQRQPRLRAPMS